MNEVPLDYRFDPATVDALDPAQLEQRRRDIVNQMAQFPRTFADAPTGMLQELAYLTGTLRRRTSGPPKAAKATKRPGAGAPPATVDDLDAMF